MKKTEKGAETNTEVKASDWQEKVKKVRGEIQDIRRLLKEV